MTNGTTSTNKSENLTLETLQKLIKEIGPPPKTQVLCFHPIVPDDMVYKGIIIDMMLKCKPNEEGWFLPISSKDYITSMIKEVEKELMFGTLPFIEIRDL